MSAYSTQVQVDTGQRMVYALRYRLFEHLQALGLTITSRPARATRSTAIDVDAYAIENLLIGGLSARSPR